MKRTLWRKESEASHSSHFIFTKYFLCRRSDGLSLETHSSCLALFELSMPVDSHSGTWLARAGLFLSLLEDTGSEVPWSYNQQQEPVLIGVL